MFGRVPRLKSDNCTQTPHYSIPRFIGYIWTGPKTVLRAAIQRQCEDTRTPVSAGNIILKTIKDAADDNVVDDDDRRMILVLMRTMINTCIYSLLLMVEG